MNTNARQFPEQITALVTAQTEILKFIERTRTNYGKTEPDQLEKQVRWFYKCHIRPHIALENKIITRFIPGDHHFRTRAGDDYDDILELFLSLSDEFDRGLLELFFKRLEKHIQFGKNELFPFLQTLDAEALLQVEQMITTTQKEIPGSPEPSRHS